MTRPGIEPDSACLLHYASDILRRTGADRPLRVAVCTVLVCSGGITWTSSKLNLNLN
jgi:hypothetical protein